MSRLYDRLMRLTRLPSYMRDDLLDAVVVSGDNIAEYFFAGTTKDDWDIKKDFPNLAPPFPAFFVDIRHPSGTQLHSGGFQPWNQKGVRAWGFYIVVRSPLTSITQRRGEVVQDAHWEMQAALFCDGKEFAPSGPLVIFRFWVRSDGTLCRLSDDQAAMEMQVADERLLDAFTGEDRRKLLYHDMCIYLKPALLTICFMHCKNVVTKVERPPDWQQKAAVKKHKRPLVTYHVLEIEPMKQVLRTEGKSEEVGLKRALHICRGHFATYDEKPLFGRVKGTFWREAHVRGSLKEGLALKDYDVQAPKPLLPTIGSGD